MGNLEGRVAFITGVARGQGRSHALRLAKEGVDIVGLDVCQTSDLDGAYPMATREDLDETKKLVENLGRRMIAAEVDVRDYEGVRAVAEQGWNEFGRYDILLANAGMMLRLQTLLDTPTTEWHQTIGSCLDGHFHALKAVAPYMIQGGRGGAIVMTASAAGMIGFPNCGPYTAAKTGVLGLMRVAASELGEHHIRVNAISPTSCNTDFIQNEPTYKVFCPDIENPTIDDVKPAFQAMNKIPVPWIEPEDVSNYIAWLVSDEARYVTGSVVTVDAGMLL